MLSYSDCLTVCLSTLTPRTRNPALSLSFRPCVQEPAGNIKVKFDDVKQEVDKQSVALVTAAVLAVSGHFEGIDLIQRERDSTERCVRLVSVCVCARTLLFLMVFLVVALVTDLKLHRTV